MKTVYLSISNRAEGDFVRKVRDALRPYDCNVISYADDTLGADKCDILIVVPQHKLAEPNVTVSKNVGMGNITETRTALAKDKNVYIALEDEEEICFYRIKGTRITDARNYVNTGQLLFASSIKSQLRATVMNSNGIYLKTDNTDYGNKPVIKKHVTSLGTSNSGLRVELPPTPKDTIYVKQKVNTDISIVTKANPRLRLIHLLKK